MKQLDVANVLADADWSVRVFEAGEEPGGSLRSTKLIEPEYTNDIGSAFYPPSAISRTPLSSDSPRDIAGM